MSTLLECSDGRRREVHLFGICVLHRRRATELEVMVR